MKKSVVIAGVIVLTAAAYTGVSWYVGMESEKTIRAAVDQANSRIVSSLGPDLGTQRIHIDISEYRRGVFSTEARYTLVLEDGDERLELGMADHLQHGPFPWALAKQGSFTPLLAYSRSQLVDTEAVKRWFDAARGVMPLEVDTRIGFGGEGESVWSFAPLEWAVEDDRLSFSGGQMQMQFSNDFRDSEGEGRFASLVVGDGAQDDSVALKDIVLNTRSTQADDVVEVNSTLKAASLVIHDMTEDAVTAEQVAVTLESRQKASLLDAALRYEFGRVLVGDIDLGSVTLGGEVASFDYEAVSALMAEYEAIESEHVGETDEEFELTPDDEARLMAKIVPVLASSPKLALQPVVWRNDKGETTLSVSAAFQPLPATEVATEQDILAQGLRELRIELKLSRPMFLQAFAQTGASEEEKQQLEMLAAMLFDQYVGEMESQGLVQREGDQASITIVYGNDAVDVNGETMSVDEFLLLFAGFLM